MLVPLQIIFKKLAPSESIKADITELAMKLERYAKHITSCRVIVEVPHRHHRKGKLYSIKIDVTLPGKEILVTRHSDQHHAHEDIYVAISDAFNATQRQLEDYVRRHRGKVKLHKSAPHGKVIQLFPHEDYGIIESSDGREIYFNRNSILNMDFDKLEIGTKVHYAEEMGEQGPQASTIHVEGKHHVV